MSDIDTPAPAPAGTCRYCGRAPGGLGSTAFPFRSEHDGTIRVLVLPRCDACHAFHERQQAPAGLIVVGCAAVPAVLLSLLPLPEGIRGVVTMVGLLVGAGAGIVFVADREARAAKRAGTRPSSDFVTEPAYRALAGDSATWRAYPRTVARPEGSAAPKRDTVAEYRRAFADDPPGLAALRQGCRDAAVPVPE